MNYKFIFLAKFVLGHKVNLNSTEEVIKACCSKAYDDMNTGIKYVWSNKILISPDIKKNKNDFIAEYIKIIKKHGFCFSKLLIHDCFELFGVPYSPNHKDYMISGNEKGRIREFSVFGACQKLVNMSFKYFYVFDNLINKDIDFSHCDCPIDSIILNTLHLNEEDQNIKWTRLIEADYDRIQDMIHTKLSVLNESLPCDKRLTGLGNLSYDFIEW